MSTLTGLFVWKYLSFLGDYGFQVFVEKTHYWYIECSFVFVVIFVVAHLLLLLLLFLFALVSSEASSLLPTMQKKSYFQASL